MTNAVPPWLLENRSPPNRPTEIFLAVEVGIGPVWSHNEDRGGWFARLDVPPGLDPWWECDHIHPTQDEAWSCAESAARGLIPVPQSGRMS